MSIKWPARIILVASFITVLSGCLASSLVGSAVTRGMVGPPGSASYTTAANAHVVDEILKSQISKIGAVQSSDDATGEIVGFDAKRHYVYSAKVRSISGTSGSTVDLKVQLLAGALTVGKVKTIDVMNSFVRDVNRSMAAAPLVPIQKKG